MAYHNDTCGCADCGNYGQRYNPHAVHNQSCGCDKCNNYGPVCRVSTRYAYGADTRPSGFEKGTATTWSGAQDCCRQTTCPKCGALVYFVRHNGGSVWFDSLGKPWPKHRCFADDPVAVKLRSRLAEKELARRALLVGVVIETVVTHPGSGGKVVIQYGENQRLELTVIASADLTELPGTLVLLAVDDSGYPRLHWGPELLQRAMGLAKFAPEPLASTPVG